MYGAFVVGGGDVGFDCELLFELRTDEPREKRRMVFVMEGLMVGRCERK